MAEDGKDQNTVEDQIVTSKPVKDKEEATAKARKSFAQGLIDYGLLSANANQLKTILKIGEDQDFYEVKLFLIITCLVFQVIIGVLKIASESKVGLQIFSKKCSKQKCSLIILVLVFFVIILNTFILAFGIAPRHSHGNSTIRSEI